MSDTGNFDIYTTGYHEEKGLPQEGNSDPDEPCDGICYTQNQIKMIRWVYFFAIIGWLFLIFWYQLFPPLDFIEAGILVLPLMVFLISYSSIPHITEQVEGYMFKANLLTLGLLIALPLLNWAYSNFNGNRVLFIKLAATAIIFSMLTLIDVWVPHRFLPLEKHIKSILQTSAITLLIFALYRFFIEKAKEPKEPKVTETVIRESTEAITHASTRE